MPRCQRRAPIADRAAAFVHAVAGGQRAPSGGRITQRASDTAVQARAGGQRSTQAARRLCHAHTRRAAKAGARC
eukprot:352327-Chlamydomonas_euryale.AAC.1